jgi:nicotinate-nucleotide adenylyltransferase
MRVGLLGGAFDPPHLGHLICAQYTLEALGLEKILFIPSGDHPFKRTNVTASMTDRLAMVKLAIATNEKFEASDIECKREGVTYTIDTIEVLQSEHPDWEIYLLIGADNITDFEKWHRYQDILRAVKITIFRRSTNDGVVQERSDFIFPNTPIIDISSTEIRQRIRQGKSAQYLLSPAVEEYIRSTNLYK